MNPSTATGAGSGAVPGLPKSADAATASSDPSAAIRADPNRHAWLTDAMLPLPVGTERVYGGSDTHVRIAMPSGHLWADYDPHWNCAHANREIDADQWEVYHVPPPQPEKAKDDYTILPPAEIADHATELGWTVGSEVWHDKRVGQFRVYPSGRVLDLRKGKVWDTASDRDYCRSSGDTLLPNRRVLKPKPAAASAWEEFAERCGHPATWCPVPRREFDEWLAAREKAAVEASRLNYQQGFKDGESIAEHKHQELERAVNRLAALAPKPDAGRAEGVKCPKCGDTAGLWDPDGGRMYCVHSFCYENGNVYVFAPKPRRAPEVVAEEIIAKWAGDQYARDRGYSRLTAIIAAAVRADRKEHE